MGFLVLWANKFDPNTDPTYSTVMFSIFNGNVRPVLWGTCMHPVADRQVNKHDQNVGARHVLDTTHLL